MLRGVASERQEEIAMGQLEGLVMAGLVLCGSGLLGIGWVAALYSAF
jgi:hypothetical protein